MADRGPGLAAVLAQVEVAGRRAEDDALEASAAELTARSGAVVLAQGVSPGSSHGGELERLEHLCRYVTRPPIATQRLELAPDGRVLYGFKRHWRDGTSAVSFDPLTFVERLAALVPPPHAHQLTYHGVLAPASAWHDLVVPTRTTAPAAPFRAVFAPASSTAPGQLRRRVPEFTGRPVRVRGPDPR